VYLWFISSCVPRSETLVMQPTSPLGIPARSPASARMRAASALHLAAEGCGAIITALRALTPIRILNMAVEVGLVLGVSPATIPIGQAISYTRRAWSKRMTPTVLMSFIASHRMRVVRIFFNVLCSGTPKPVSSVAMRPSRSAASYPASAIAAQMRSTSAWVAWVNCFCASCAATARLRASCIDCRS